MAEMILDRLLNQEFMLAVLAAIAVGFSILTIGLPFIERDEMKARMKLVALERDRLRMQAREQARAAAKEKPISLRNEPGRYIRGIVDRFDLMKYVGTDAIRDQLRMGGYRGQAPLYLFLFFRLVMPVVFFLLAIFYIFVVLQINQPLPIRLAIAAIAGWFGFKLPGILLQNQIQKRQHSIRRALPDALDLLLICVEAGMPIEGAFKKVAAEIGGTSVPLAEEFSLATAELAYLQDRRLAYENLAARTGIDEVKGLAMALIQAEKYGTSIGQTLRVMSQEVRDLRMLAAEKKAAALPPKLTVPMIIFFLPVLFVIVLGPAGIQIARMLSR